MFQFDRSLLKVTSSVGTIRLFAVALPLLMENIMNNLLGTVSTIVLSGYSENAVAAVGAANSLISTFGGFFSVIAMGATVVISNSIGAEKLKQAKEITFVTLVLCSGVGFLSSMLMCLFRYNIMSFMNLQGQLLEDAVCYFVIRMGFFLFVAISSSISAVLRCYGYALSTVIAGLVTNFINVGLSIFVIHLPQHSPITGVAGVAVACVVSQFIGLIIYMFLFQYYKIQMCHPSSVMEFWRYSGKILRIGIPTGLSNSSFALSQTIITSFVVLMGTYALNAKVYYMNILCYVYLFSVSVGSANALLVGRWYGAGNVELADRANRQLVKVTVLVNLVISLVVFLARIPILSLFTKNETILALSFSIMLVDMIAEVARGISQVYEYALRATGDVLFTVVVLIISCWCFSIGLSYVLGIRCGLGLLGCWIGLAADESVRAITTFGKWEWNKKRRQIRNVTKKDVEK